MSPDPPQSWPGKSVVLHTNEQMTSKQIVTFDQYTLRWCFCFICSLRVQYFFCQILALLYSLGLILHTNSEVFWSKPSRSHPHRDILDFNLPRSLHFVFQLLVFLQLSPFGCHSYLGLPDLSPLLFSAPYLLFTPVHSFRSVCTVAFAVVHLQFQAETGGFFWWCLHAGWLSL